MPAELLKPLHALQAPLQDWLEQSPDAEAHAQLLDLYFAVQDITRAAERYDEHFVTQLSAYGSDLTLQLLCLDPSAFVDASLACGRAAALFSATLTPPGYYRSVLGCPDARAVALESPFPQEHLGLYCLPGISTRYQDREASIPAVSDALAALAGGKVGNYLAFFPSYAYLRAVWEDFSARYPAIPTLVQESGLDDGARAAVDLAGGGHTHANEGSGGKALRVPKGFGRFEHRGQDGGLVAVEADALLGFGQHRAGLVHDAQLDGSAADINGKILFLVHKKRPRVICSWR